MMISEKMQICTQCNTENPKTCYTKFRQICKTCYNKQNYAKFKIKYGPEYYRQNAKLQIQRLKQNNDEYAKKKETQREWGIQYYQRNKAGILQKMKERYALKQAEKNACQNDLKS